LKGAADCIEMDSLGHLPVAVHRALEEKSLHDQRDRAERDLRRSEARYRALAGNLSYGICRCNADGRFLEVNDALMRILGYASREELLALALASEIIQDPLRRARLLGQTTGDTPLDPFEVEWKKKDDVTMKVRLSGREVFSEQGDLEAYEIIAEDVTRQRQLEDHLRRQAASDPLTGLPNYRHLVDVLAWLRHRFYEKTATNEIRSRRVVPTTDVPILWTDHPALETVLLGMRRVSKTSLEWTWQG
jgi:PAS domain S-box-containing protein